MINQPLKDLVVGRLLPRVETPGQYVGGELGAVVKNPRRVRGRLCLAFPDVYTIGMSHHGLQVLYAVMNRRDDWACERVFAPRSDMEHQLRQHRLPLYSLETFTPLGQFDLIGFTLQHELDYTNVLTILDLAGIPIVAAERTLDHPLVIAGGPCAHNPEPMARFIDLFVIGDGEEMLPRVCDEWLRLRGPRQIGKADPRSAHPAGSGDPGQALASSDSRQARASLLAEMAVRLPSVYVPQCYEPQYGRDGEVTSLRPLRDGLAEVVQPAVVADLDAVPLPTAPVVPNVECVQDRIAIEIMRGCPWRCRFCQSSTIKRPLRWRRVETIVAAALASYRNTGYDELSLLSLSTSDYPQFDLLMPRLRETLRPLDVSISVPSLRVNEQLAAVSEMLQTDRHSGLTLAPEAALDQMRRRIGKPIANADLIEGCRAAFQKGFHRVKLYFMCGLPGERAADLDGIVEMAESIAQLGRQVRGRKVEVVVAVSNFVPKPHTPFQWHAMQRREYFTQAREYLFRRRRVRAVELRCHDVDASLLEGVLCRGDRRVGAAIELAWRRGARLDAWTEHAQPELWWEVLRETGIDLEATLHRPRLLDERLPWDHIAIRQGRQYLQREHACAAEEVGAVGGGKQAAGSGE